MSKPLMLSLMLVASTSWAADVPGARDLPEVTRPLTSEIVKYKEGVGKAIRFPLDRVERVNNRVTIDTELELDGHVVDITYQLSARMDYHTYLTNLTAELEALGAEMLFQCESRACGSSGLWANSLFQVTELYGPNQAQRYLAVKLPGQAERYLSAYGVERGNRRQYVHLRLVEPGAESRQIDSQSMLISDGRVVLPVLFAGNRVSPESIPLLEELAASLAGFPVEDLAITAFTAVTPGGSLGDALVQSQARAEHVQSVLQQSGLTIVHAHGLGALVRPQEGASPERAELVRFRP
jgi:hypothetical protein